MKKRRATLLKLGVSTLISLLVALAVLATHGFWQAEDPAERCRLLCDGFFVPGALLVSAGALIFVSNYGLFNGISYAARYEARMFVPWSGKRDESYGDYVSRRAEKGKLTGYGFLFLVGGVFLAVSLVFLALFYHYFEG